MTRQDYYPAISASGKGMVCFDMALTAETIKSYERGNMVLYSESVKEYFESGDYAKLLKDGVRTIATHIIH